MQVHTPSGTNFQSSNLVASHDLYTSVMYYCCARFEEAQALLTENVKVLASSNLEIVFCNYQMNQFKDRRSSFVTPCTEAGQLCPVCILIAYRNCLVQFGGSEFFFLSLTGNRIIIQNSQISYSNARSLFVS